MIYKENDGLMMKNTMHPFDGIFMPIQLNLTDLV